MKLSVITSYRDRFENLKRYVESIKKTNKNLIEFILVSEGDEKPRKICKENNIDFYLLHNSDVFQTSLAHNVGVSVSSAKWILKQDVDCITPDYEFYEKLIEYIENNQPEYMIIGAVYLDNGVRCFTEDEICGNQYIIKKIDYLELGGEDLNFQGYGFEDYEFLYRLRKRYDPEFELSEKNYATVVNRVREELIKPKNREAFGAGFIFHHYGHFKRCKDGYRDNLQKNQKLLWKTVNES